MNIPKLKIWISLLFSNRLDSDQQKSWSGVEQHKTWEMEGHLKCSLEIPHSRNYREIGYNLSAQGGLGSLGSPSLFEASAVGVLSLHRIHLQRNCSIFRHCVNDVAFAGLSDVLCALHAASCCRRLLRSRWILVGVLQRSLFRLKIEDFQPLVVLVVLCHLNVKLFVIHRL